MGYTLQVLTVAGKVQRLNTLREARRIREGEMKNHARVHKGHKTALNGTKAREPNNYTLNTAKSRQERKFQAREHNERESNTAKARSTAHNTAKTRYNARTQQRTDEHTAQWTTTKQRDFNSSDNITAPPTAEQQQPRHTSPARNPGTAPRCKAHRITAWHFAQSPPRVRTFSQIPTTFL